MDAKDPNHDSDLVMADRTDQGDQTEHERQAPRRSKRLAAMQHVNVLEGSQSSSPPGRDIADVLSQLSITEPTTLLHPASNAGSHNSTPPPSIPPKIARPTRTLGRKGKYYVVSVGRQTGVFTDWNYVAQLVSGVPGNAHQSYKSKIDADAAYDGLKEAGLVRIVQTH